MFFRKQLSAIVIAAILILSAQINGADIQKRAGGSFWAINYGIDQNNCPSSSLVQGQLTTLKAYTSRIKTFSLVTCNQGDLIMQASQAVGLRLYLGLWVSSDLNAFAAEKNKLMELIKTYTFDNVDGIVVGSEALYRKDLSPETLTGLILEVKQVLTAAGMNIPVATADVYYEFDPAVIAQLDFLMMNAFPYWEGVAINRAVPTLFSHYDYVETISTGKPVVIGETGWPTHGRSFGSSVASVPNQEVYLKGVLCQARQRNISVSWFEGLDESYKGTDVEGAWGFLDSNGNPKSSSYPAVFQNAC